MGADSTLVQASFKEALSRAGTSVPNLKPLYDSRVDTMKQFGDIVTGLIGEVKKDNELLRIGRDKQLAGFKKIADEGFQKLYAQDEPMPNKVVNALRDRIKELQEEFETYNTYGKNDTEENNDARMRLMGELRRITGEVVDTRANFQDILGNANNWNKERINPENISTYQSFLDISGMDANDDVTVDYVNGRLTFINSATGKQFTARQIKEGIPEMDKKMKVFGQDRFTSAGRKGQLDGKNDSHNYYDNDLIMKETESVYRDEIQDEEDFMNASTIEVASGSGIFKNDLLDHTGISLELVKNMYYTEDGKTIPIGEIYAQWDQDGDNDVDAEDVAAISKLSPAEIEAFKMNHKRMVSALTDRYDPAFDLEISKQLYGEWAANKEAQYYNRFWKDNKPKPEEGEEGLGSWIGSGNSLRAQGAGGNGWIEYYEATDMYNELEKAMNGEDATFSVNNVTYRYNAANKVWTGKGIRKEGVSTQLLIGKNTGFKISHPDFDKFRVVPKKEILDPKVEKVIEVKSKNKKELAKEMGKFTMMDERRKKEFLGLPKNVSQEDYEKAVDKMMKKYKEKLTEIEG